MGASTKHQLILGNLYFHFRQQSNDVEPNPIILFAPYTLTLEEFGKVNRLSYAKKTRVFLDVEPDMIVVSAERKDRVIGKNGAIGSPDLVIEILSPSTRENDLNGIHGKKKLYEYNRVPEYWIIDPENDTVTVFLSDDNNDYSEVKQYNRGSSITSSEISTLSIDLDLLFQMEVKK